ncbi:HAD family hydrolase [Bacteriovorax sp. Seq25_V]|uniref:HAD family hydrolase n=1 Tax=Bacteriovorax sp. Seq25_V TaxID=1201288 RepID=UPI00038A44D0|nr:HAD family hydrolase [Bacteriovorax sp. Seq25_V]EQC47237.1 HAD hydrolase, family IIB [Bacteriovorax sp. Seq25_V]
MKNNLPKIVFSDFDGTLTDHTEFSGKFLTILEMLKEYNTPLVIVTGRSLSWAHFFLTHFSDLPYVISEGGGVLSYRDKRGMIVDEYQVPVSDLEWLENFSKELLGRFEGLKLSADSIGRKSDRAIELCDLEDVVVRTEIKKLMDDQNINYSTSNVHLNFWCGDISKYKAVRSLLDKFYPDVSIEQTMYFGDSLNDQSMFKMVEHSVGVSNISEVLLKMTDKPKVILTGEENSGPSGVLNYLVTLFDHKLN